MSTPTLPPSAVFALWFTAWLHGHVSLDDARDAIVGQDAAHDVAGLPGEPTSQPLIVAMGRMRAAGATGAGIALPVPGDPLGLAGPSAFNVEVMEAGEGVLLVGAPLGLVPARAGAGVVWLAAAAVSRRQLPDPSEAGTGLRRALLVASRALADLDVARWRPEVADELMALRGPVTLDVPRSVPQPAVQLADQAARCLAIVDLALEDEGGSVTAAQMQARRAALLPLGAAARRGLVAACSSEVWT